MVGLPLGKHHLALPTVTVELPSPVLRRAIDGPAMWSGLLTSRRRPFPMVIDDSPVGLEGFEPSTSPLLMERAHNCATGPLLMCPRTITNNYEICQLPKLRISSSFFFPIRSILPIYSSKVFWSCSRSRSMSSSETPAPSFR